MAHLIDKDALIAEIKRRKQDAINNCGGFKSMREHECDSCIVGQYEEMEDILNTLEVKEVDYERELSKYVSDGIHCFFSNVDDDYCKMDSVIWQDYIIETAEHFFDLGLKAAQKGE